MTDYVALLLAEQEEQARQREREETLTIEWEDGPLAIRQWEEKKRELARAAAAEQWSERVEEEPVHDRAGTREVPAGRHETGKEPDGAELVDTGDGATVAAPGRRQGRRAGVPLLEEAERALFTGEWASDKTALGVLLARMRAQSRTSWEEPDTDAQTSGGEALLDSAREERFWTEPGGLEVERIRLNGERELEPVTGQQEAQRLYQAAWRSLAPLPQAAGETRVVTLERPGRETGGGMALDAERLDRIFRRDARRFDGGMQLL